MRDFHVWRVARVRVAPDFDSLALSRCSQNPRSIPWARFVITETWTNMKMQVIGVDAVARAIGLLALGLRREWPGKPVETEGFEVSR